MKDRLQRKTREEFLGLINVVHEHSRKKGKRNANKRNDQGKCERQRKTVEIKIFLEKRKIRNKKSDKNGKYSDICISR